MDKNEYKIQMLKITKMLCEDDVKSLKYIFSEIGEGVLEKVQTPLELIRILEKNGFVDADNLELFINALENLQRKDIAKILKEKSQGLSQVPEKNNPSVQEVGYTCCDQKPSSNNESMVVLNKKETLNETKNIYDTKLTAAIKMKYDIKSIEKILEENPNIINTPESKFDELPIIVAVNYNNMELLKYLLDQGADINKQIGKFGKTALYVAVVRNNKNAASILLNHTKVDMCIKCCLEENTALHCAVSKNDVEMLEILVQHAKEKGVFQQLMATKNKNEHTPDKVSTATSHEAINRLKVLVDNRAKDNAATTQKNNHGGNSYTINNANKVSITNLIYSPTSLNNDAEASNLQEARSSSLTYESSKLSNVLFDDVTRVPSSPSDKITRAQSSPSDKQMKDFYFYMQLRQFHLSSMQN